MSSEEETKAISSALQRVVASLITLEAVLTKEGHWARHEATMGITDGKPIFNEGGKDGA